MLIPAHHDVGREEGEPEIVRPEFIWIHGSERMDAHSAKVGTQRLHGDNGDLSHSRKC